MKITAKMKLDVLNGIFDQSRKVQEQTAKMMKTTRKGLLKKLKAIRQAVKNEARS